MNKGPRTLCLYLARPPATRNERGSTLVEFALVIMVVLTLMMGIMEFSRFLYTFHFVSDAAREGTRYSSVRGNTFVGTVCSTTRPYACDATAANVQTYVQSLAPPGIVGNSITVTTTWPGATPSGSTAPCTSPNASNSVGCYVQVLVSYPYKFMFPFLPSGLTTWTVTSTSEVVISQ
jgi:Flp pilus assembly protein TadG